MADSPLPAKTDVKTFDDIGPEFNFTVKVSKANPSISLKNISLFYHAYYFLKSFNHDFFRFQQGPSPSNSCTWPSLCPWPPRVETSCCTWPEWTQTWVFSLPPVLEAWRWRGVKTDLWRPQQGGSVSCDSSSLVDPLKIGMKSHTQTFSKENLRQTEKVVSFSSSRLSSQSKNEACGVVFTLKSLH